MVTLFPKNAIVNTPAEQRLEGDCSVSVRISTNDDPSSLQEFYGKRLFNFEIEAKSVADLDLINSLKGCRVRVNDASVGIFKSDDTIRPLRDAQPVFVVRLDDDILRNINFLTSLNAPVHIDISSLAASEKALMQVLDFYLHNPLLSIPIEPLHSMLRTINRKRGITLWATEHENINNNFFVSDSGEITLSKRWNDNKLNYGTIEDSFDDIESSKLYQRLVSFKAELFRNSSPCIFCDHFGPCVGFLKAIEPEQPCESWKNVFKTLADESEKAKDLLQKFQQQQD